MRFIPTRSVAIDQVPDFDFRKANTLPRRWINNSFVGWNGLAEIVWPERQLRLSVNTPDTSCYHVYSPDDRAGFFCFETETHIPDAATLIQAEQQGAPDWIPPGGVLTHEARFMETFLWSGTSRPVNHITSTLRPASRSSRPLEGMRSK